MFDKRYYYEIMNTENKLDNQVAMSESISQPVMPDSVIVPPIVELSNQQTAPLITRQKSILSLLALSFGITSIILSVLSILFVNSLLVFFGDLLGVTAVILAIVGLVSKNGKKLFHIVGLVSGALAMILCVVGFILYAVSSLSSFIVGDWRITNGNNDKNQVMSFKSDGKYYWYRDGSDRKDNYYYGTYTFEVGNKTNDKGQLTAAGGELLYTLTLDQNGVRKDNGSGDRSNESNKLMFLGEVNSSKDKISMASTNADLYELEKVKN